MTVVDLANKVGVDKAIISKILHRKLAPSKVMMMKINSNMVFYVTETGLFWNTLS